MAPHSVTKQNKCPKCALALRNPNLGKAQNNRPWGETAGLFLKHIVNLWPLWACYERPLLKPRAGP